MHAIICVFNFMHFTLFIVYTEWWAAGVVVCLEQGANLQ